MTKIRGFKTRHSEHTDLRRKKSDGVKSPVIQQPYKMKDIWRIHALNDYFLQYLNFVILSILVRNAAQQKCESEGNKRGRHKEC